MRRVEERALRDLVIAVLEAEGRAGPSALGVAFVGERGDAGAERGIAGSTRSPP
jgi:hypothetical protein